ncbi:MAG: trigger factor [Endomicrobia bacterium]|nr:trigger factor [Endomicrobiia bacterium]MCL2798948.1 trigger factor [Endomicrobiia bacterium]
MAQENGKIDFKSSVADKKLCSITIDIEVSSEIAGKEIDSAFNQLQQQARLDGFRQGKAPMNLIKDKYAKEAKDKAIENIVKNTVFDALAKENFVPIDFPIVDEFEYEIGQALKYRFTAECHPKIEVKNYKGISVRKEIFKVTDKSLGQTLDALRDRNAKLVPSSTGIATEKSFVSVDYDAFDDKGVVLPEITAKNHMLDLSSENTLKGFAKALKGAKAGDEKDAKVEYPSDYPNKTLAGKTITFKTKVIEIKEKELPELNDDFAKDMGTENLEDLKNKVKESVETEEKRRQDMDAEKQVVEYLVEKNKFEVPQSLVVQQKEHLIERMKNYFKNQGMPKEFIEKQVETGENKFKDEAEKNVRLSYILNTIYTNENLAVTDADLEAEKNKMKESNPGRTEAVDKYFAEKKENIMLSLKETKLFKFLLDNAKIKEEVKEMPLKKEG